MRTVEVQARITESGQLDIELPAGLPAGEVTVRIEVPDVSASARLKTGAEIVAMLMTMDPEPLVDPEITDPVEWVKAQRRKEAERLNSYWEN